MAGCTLLARRFGLLSLATVVLLAAPGQPRARGQQPVQFLTTWVTANLIEAGQMDGIERSHLTAMQKGRLLLPYLRRGMSWAEATWKVTGPFGLYGEAFSTDLRYWPYALGLSFNNSRRLEQAWVFDETGQTILLAWQDRSGPPGHSHWRRPCSGADQASRRHRQHRSVHRGTERPQFEGA